MWGWPHFQVYRDALGTSTDYALDVFGYASKQHPSNYSSTYYKQPFFEQYNYDLVCRGFHPVAFHYNQQLELKYSTPLFHPHEGCEAGGKKADKSEVKKFYDAMEEIN
tara:strand:- start:456 stop:779 length:324 start_codon:yes stop_codon:yes gene_type:complete